MYKILYVRKRMHSYIYISIVRYMKRVYSFVYYITLYTHVSYIPHNYDLYTLYIHYILLAGPFWFNPVTFEWNKLQEDYSIWLRWMTETGGSG